MKRNLDENLDKRIKNYFNNETKGISAPDNMFFKVRSGIAKKEKGGFLNMKIGFFKVKTIAAAAAICILTTATCGAVTNGVFWTGSSLKLTEVHNFPTEDTVENTVGYLPKYVESFDGGFKFKSFNHSNEQLKRDGDSEALVSGKGTEFEYSRDGAEKTQNLSLNAHKIDEKYLDLADEKSNEESVKYKDIEISYSNFKYKAVPPEYIATDEEKQEVEDGTLQIGYGSDEVSVDNSQAVSWYEDGIEYSILNTNYDDVTKDQMIKMAQDVIDK